MPGSVDRYIRSPLRNSVQDTLGDRIRKGHYRPGDRIPPERDLAEELGVSRAVIRAALNGLEATGLIVRSPGCRPIVPTQTTTQSLNGSARRSTLALWLVHRPSDGEAPSILYGIQHSLDPTSHRLIVANAIGENWDAVLESEHQFLHRMTEDRDIAGLLMWYVGGEDNLPALWQVRKAGIPIVFMDRLPPDGFEADHVGVDNYTSAEAAVNHLIELGHKRIVHLTNYDEASPVHDRLKGYRSALEAAHIPFEEDLVIKCRLPGATSDYIHQEIIERILHLRPKPTAVFALNDRIALELIDTLRKEGIRVPEDISVVGFDGIERYMPGSPFLTACYQPFQRIAAHAVELLLWRIDHGATASYRHVLLEAPLVVQGSTQQLSR